MYGQLKIFMLFEKPIPLSFYNRLHTAYYKPLYSREFLAWQLEAGCGFATSKDF